MILAVKTLEEYMAQYGSVLGEQISRAVKPLHTPGKDSLFVCDANRKAFEGQSHLISGSVKAMNLGMKSGIVCGECGTGKTFMSMMIAHTHANGKPYRAFVMCPPHLLEKWKREIEETLPGATAMIVRKYRDVSYLRFRPEPMHAEWFIVSQTTAKLGQPWKPVYKRLTKAQTRLNAYAKVKGWSEVPHKGHCFCPSCGAAATKTKAHEAVFLEPEELEKRKYECQQCKEPLWQWENAFDRWPVASFIHRLGRGIIDYLVIDEAHEAKAEDSEIALASHKFISISRHVLSLTGTLIGGYADHLFFTGWRLFPHVMQKHGLRYSGVTDFNESYGRIEYRISDKGGGQYQSTKMARGKKLSGRTTKTRKPGIMPRLFADLLMQNAVFLSLSEISDGLPELVQSVSPCEMDDDIRKEYEQMKTAVTNEVKKMMAKRDGRLLGKMLSVLLGYPDMPRGWGDIGYFENNDDGTQEWKLVYPTKDFDIDGRIFPKEQELLDICLKEKTEGRQVWVYTTMTDKHDTCERLKSILSGAGLSVGILRAKVKPDEREQWIYDNGKGIDVMISHPELVKTGLDLFAKNGNHNFCSLVFYQTGYNLFTLRQAGARHWRIGQPKQCRTFFLCCKSTMQEVALSLMGDKMTAAQAIEGSFSEDGLAALAGEDGSIEMAMAKSISNAIQCDATRSWEKLGTINSKPKTAEVVVPAPVVETKPVEQVKREPKRTEAPRQMIVKTRGERPRQGAFDFPDQPWNVDPITRKAGLLF